VLRGLIYAATFNREEMRKCFGPRSGYKTRSKECSRSLSALDPCKRTRDTITYYFKLGKFFEINYGFAGSRSFDIDNPAGTINRTGFWIHKLINWSTGHHESSGNVFD